MPEDEAETVREQIKEIKKNRQWGQPYVRTLVGSMLVDLDDLQSWA